MPLTRRARRASGQALILLALAMLVLALGALYTLSLGQLLRNKTTAQASADAAAYSMAIAEARAFNHLSLTNRARLADYTAMMAVASYQSYLSYHDEHTWQTLQAWEIDIPAMLSAYIGCCSNWVTKTCTYTYSCNCSTSSDGSSSCSTCSHTYDCSYCGTYCHSAACRQAASAALSVPPAVVPHFRDEHERVHELLHDPTKSGTFALIRPFSDTARRLLGNATALRDDQDRVWRNLVDHASGQRLGLQVARMTHPGVTGPAYGNRGPTWSHLTDAVVGMATNGVANETTELRDVYFEALMATRYPTFVSARDAGGGYTAGKTWREVVKAAMDAGQALNAGTPAYSDAQQGTSKTLASGGSSLEERLHDNSPFHSYAGGHGAWGGGFGLGAGDHGESRNSLTFACDTVRSDRSARVEVWHEPHDRNDRGYHHWGGHPPGPARVHERQTWGDYLANNIYDIGGCLDPQIDPSPSACGLGMRFPRFRLVTSDRDPVNNQPYAYSLLTVPVGSLTPWQLASRIEGPAGSGGERSVDVSTRLWPVTALSQALVYYHPPRDNSDSWREPPSFFNPFWRAKLQPMTAQQALDALTATGPDLTATQQPVPVAQQQVNTKLNQDARAILATPGNASLVR